MIKPLHSISELKVKIEEEIIRLDIKSYPADLYDPVKYMLSLPAKRMRPVLVLMGCELFEGDIELAINPAMGIEVFHNFTLLHDDIMDNAPLRRSSPTVHTKWNHNVAILSGDTMFVKASQLIMNSPDYCSNKVMEVYLNAATMVCEGQQLDMNFEKGNSLKKGICL